jgi:hypothetical protein
LNGPHGPYENKTVSEDSAVSTMEEGQDKVQEGPEAVERGRSRSPVDDEGLSMKITACLHRFQTFLMVFFHFNLLPLSPAPGHLPIASSWGEGGTQ